MVSRSTKKKETVQVTVKDEGDTHESANNSNESMRSRLRGFAYTSTESGAMGSPSNSEVKVEAKISIKSTKKRKRSPSPLSSSLPAPPKPKAHKTELETSHPAPKNWEITYRAIEEMRKEKTAPVDHMGCHMPMLELKLDPRTRRFMTLISLMLSSQTKDEVTFAAIQNLRTQLRPVDSDPNQEYLTLESVLAAPISIIEECINKVGFWRRKAQYIKSATEMLHRDYEGDIPRSIEGLCSLPGVGMKMAMLAMQEAWGDNVGIGVDVHVHRITNRLRWHKRATKTPEETRLNLESWLPREFHPLINPLLVGFGQTICLPVRPKCDECLLSKKSFKLEKDGNVMEVEGPLCPSAFKFGGASPSKAKSRMVVKKALLVDEGEAKVKIEIEEAKGLKVEE